MTSVSSTEFLRVLASPGRFALLYPAFPSGKLKREVVLIKDAAGHDFTLELGFYKVRPVEMPYSILKDMQAQSYVSEDGQDGDGNTIFRLTADGNKAAEEAGGAI